MDSCLKLLPVQNSSTCLLPITILLFVSINIPSICPIVYWLSSIFFITRSTVRSTRSNAVFISKKSVKSFVLPCNCLSATKLKMCRLSRVLLLLRFLPILKSACTTEIIPFSLLLRIFLLYLRGVHYILNSNNKNIFRVMKIICKILHVGKEPEKKCTTYHPLVFVCRENKIFLEELFSRALWLLARTRREMKARILDDHYKVKVQI